MEFNAEATGEKFKAIAEAFGVDTEGMDQATYRKAAKPCRKIIFSLCRQQDFCF
jgi:alcohol dehydrogenase class IV